MCTFNSKTSGISAVDTSQSLLQRVIHHADRMAWNRFVDIYQPLLSRWLRRYDLQPHDVDDLTQDVLLYVAKELPQFDHNGQTGAFRCWLRQILVYRLRTFWNNRDKVPAAPGRSDLMAELEQLEDSSSGLSQIWDRQYEEQVLSRLLEHIRPRFEESTWRAFQMLVFEQKKPAEVAKILQMSANAVCAAKCRVLNQLRQENRGLMD